MKKSWFKKPKSRLIFFAVIVIIFIGASAFAARALKDSPRFKVADIFVNKEGPVDLSYLKGVNIFSLDLQKESKYISQLYPTYKGIRLFRILPNRLFVDFVKRVPVAYIKLYRYFSVDDEAVLFEAAGQLGDAGLPLIVGLETKIFGPKPGARFNKVKELRLALNIIKEAGRNRILKGCKIKRIDVSNIADTSFFIVLPPKKIELSKTVLGEQVSGLEVKIGSDKIKDKINMLGGLLVQMRKDLFNIQYIDLRFKELVVKYNNAK